LHWLVKDGNMRKALLFSVVWAIFTSISVHSQNITKNSIDNGSMNVRGRNNVVVTVADFRKNSVFEYGNYQLFVADDGWTRIDYGSESNKFQIYLTTEEFNTSRVMPPAYYQKKIAFKRKNLERYLLDITGTVIDSKAANNGCNLQVQINIVGKYSSPFADGRFFDEGLSICKQLISNRPVRR